VASSTERRVRRRPGEVSLERALSKLGLASRAEARRWIRGGRVRVDGREVSDPGLPVVPERVRLEIAGAPAAPVEARYLLLDKPRGVVTTRDDPEGRTTVYDVVGEAARGLAPVGRLDRATTGLLLLTNDTRLAAWLTDPERAIARTYLVTVRGELSEADRGRLEAGVVDAGERLAARSAVVRKRSKRETHLVVTLIEGRNREIRRLCAAVGHEVTRLRRVAFGGLELGPLSPGKWRELSAEELERALGSGAPITRGPLRATPRGLPSAAEPC
jgi:23S rRNA pseudouridine2605 synthase